MDSASAGAPLDGVEHAEHASDSPVAVDAAHPPDSGHRPHTHGRPELHEIEDCHRGPKPRVQRLSSFGKVSNNRERMMRNEYTTT